jgi:hypothetical protein
MALTKRQLTVNLTLMTHLYTHLSDYQQDMSLTFPTTNFPMNTKTRKVTLLIAKEANNSVVFL